MVIRKFNRLIIAIALASTVPLMSGCTALGVASGVAGAIADADRPADEVFNTLADEKAYYALLQFEVTANQLASNAVDMGLLKAGSQRAIKVADLLLTLTAVTNAAKQAKAAHDTLTLTKVISQGRSITNQILDLLS